ncbi:AAA family ATPase [Streptomyces sp. BPTC-684]|uniref:ATP-binding protein n=1 Tax=Streptomyces sp. BPTC-684 TaxID=3043734 RepID=UPI0024B22303|nr:AAA family ATPase [Streptomyces sp. BPTC-684]WHM41490.1 AAA family ATPase [Streptomyces sp. BPTC-684]
MKGRRTSGARRRLFERENELLLLEGMLDDLCGAGAEGDTAASSGGLLAVSGAAGLGKTSLLAEVRREAVARGCTLLTARGGEQEQRVAFHVVRQLVQPVLAAAGESEHRRILGTWYDIVAPAVGLVAVPGGGSPDPQGVRDGLDWLVTRFAVEHTPVVLIVDDAHWADDESLTWLSSFALRAAELPILIVVAYRPEELPAQASEFRRLAERHGSRPVSLAPLSPHGVGRLVHEVLQNGADDLFSRECWALTGGNPFEAVELIAKIRERNIKPHYANAAELRELASLARGSGLVERLERLGPSPVRLAWAVAILGTAVDPYMASSVGGLGAEESVDAVQRLREARILAGRAGDSDRLDFFHPLVGTAVYRAIPPAMRVAMHGQAAVCVTEAGLGPTVAARHLLEMHPEDDRWAVQQLRAAARECMRAGAPEAARRCLARALREPPSLEERAEVLFELGCSALLNEPATTVNHLQAALEEPELDPALREAITYRLAQALAHTDRMGEAAELVAVEGRSSTNPRTRLRMQAEGFKWNAFRADEEDSAARSRRLARLADHLTTRGMAERYILGLRAWDAMVRGEPAAVALSYAEEALGDGLSWTDEDWGFEVPVMVALTFMYCDQPGRADELFSKGIAECENRGWRGAHLSFGLTLLGYIRFCRGRLAEAEDLVHGGLRIADRVGQRIPAQWFALGILIEILLARGRVDEAQDLSDRYNYGQVVPNAVVYPDSETVYSELLLARGLRSDAEQRLRAVGRRLDRRGMRNPAWCPWRPLLAEALAQADPAEAQKVADEGVELARRFGTAGAIGRALHSAAKVATGAKSLKLLAEAVQHLERSPSAYELACALVDHGTALSRAGLPQDASELLIRGMESAVLCGADALAARARDELAASGLRPLRLRAVGTDSLTAQEKTVADRAARGWENTRIAEELGIRERAVELLLSGVFRKIGTDLAGLPELLRHAENRPAPGTPPR